MKTHRGWGRNHKSPQRRGSWNPALSGRPLTDTQGSQAAFGELCHHLQHTVSFWNKLPVLTLCCPVQCSCLCACGLLVRFHMQFRSYFVLICNHLHFWKGWESLTPQINVSILFDNFHGRHLRFQNCCHLGPIFVNSSKSKQDMKMIPVAMPTFWGAMDVMVRYIIQISICFSV